MNKKISPTVLSILFFVLSFTSPCKISTVIAKDIFILSQKHDYERSDYTYIITIVTEYIKNNEYKKALDFVDKSLITADLDNSENSNLWSWRGFINYHLQKYQEAVNDFSISININPYNEDSYDRRSVIFLELNQIQKALQDSNQSISLNPNNADFYYNRSKIFTQMASNSTERVKDALKMSNFQLSFSHQQQFVNYTKKALIDLQQAEKLFKKDGKIESYNVTRILVKEYSENLRLAEKNLREINEIIALEKEQKKASTFVVNEKTKEQIIKRSCLMARKGYTDGENLNEIYKLVQINASEANQQRSLTSVSTSIGSQVGRIFDNLFNNLNNIAIENTTRNIFAEAKKRCKF